MKNKKIIKIILALLLIAVTAGCAMENRENSTNPPPPGMTSRALAESGAPALADVGEDEAEFVYDYNSTIGEAILNESRRFHEPEFNERYNTATESSFLNAASHPLSTFSASPNTASYSNMRRFINNGMRPQGVRIEELINYFNFDYQKPNWNSNQPFTINTEISDCPWNKDNLLAMIGIQGKDLQIEDKIANNVVFLIDVSGSMDEPNRLPLVKQSFIMLLDKLNENDRISIVTYAGNDKILADSIRGSEKSQLKNIINNLNAGGSTAGARGIITAYELAEKNFLDGGNNRVILATDGDFNVGISNTSELTALIKEKKEKGVFLSVLGYGMYNLNDEMMESIAKEGNGNYAYIDTLEEAKKVLVDQFDSTMYVIAKDLKLQVEFNPATVKEYRLIGYDNRRLENADFNNDQKDAGDIGAGFSVTAFYELIPAGTVDPLIYQEGSQVNVSNDYMTVKVRYKEPDSDISSLVERAVTKGSYTNRPSDNFNFASSVAEFGLIISDSEYKGNADINNVLARLSDCRNDIYGLRKEFSKLVETYKKIA